jgi:hypothetical protein
METRQQVQSVSLVSGTMAGLAKFRTNRFLPIRSRGLERAVIVTLCRFTGKFSVT